MKRRVVVTPQSRGFPLKERVMTQTRKIRLVRLGDAKLLTHGDEGVGAEIGTLRKDVA